MSVSDPDEVTRDFFISYTGVDEQWAEWIAWHLEEAGYTAVLQKWDFSAGSHFVTEMHRATQIAPRTIAVLSKAYIESAYAEAEWQGVESGPDRGRQKLLVFRIEDCPRPGLLGQLVSVDLFGVDRETARSRLLAAIREGRRKPALPPDFPLQEAPTREPEFPGRFVQAELQEVIANAGPVTPENPWAVAFAFWSAALNDDYENLDNLTTPESRGRWDLAAVRERTEDSGIASGVDRPIYDVAYVKLISGVSNAESVLKVEGGYMLVTAKIISIVYRLELGGWRVHALGRPCDPD